MSEPLVLPIAKPERVRAMAKLVSAFVADPADRWLYPMPTSTEHHGFEIVGNAEAGSSPTMVLMTRAAG